MDFLKKYLLPRIMQYLVVIMLGITIVFLIPRLSPVDPVQQLISTIGMQGSYLDPKAAEKLTDALEELYGLKGSLLQQYLAFWKRLLKGDFGPSLFQFPVPVLSLIKDSLPWSAGLLTISTFLSWLIGNILGGIVGFFYQKRWAKFLDIFAMVIRPIPFYTFSLIILVVFAYLLKLFPLGGGFSVGMRVPFSWKLILDILKHTFLPALSMVVLGSALWLQTMRLIVSNVIREDFVVYAKTGGLKRGTIAFRYVMRNAMLPQVTGLALSMGHIFSGALITEIVFSYPGLGTLLYNAINTGDYNLIMGITTLSIIGISTFVLLIDILYPLFDPRIGYN